MKTETLNLELNIRLVLSTVIVVSVLASRVHACKLIEPDPIKMADHFDVVVDSFAGALPGIKVSTRRWDKRTSNYEIVAVSVTDSHGTTHFRGLRAGEYSVSTELVLDNNSVDIIVKENASEPLELKFTLRWPTRRVFHIKSLQGSLVSFPDVDEPSVVLQGIRLTLLEGYSGRETGTQLTASDGTFKFAGLAPGLYFLRLSEGLGEHVMRPWGRHDVHGDIPVEINPADDKALEDISLQIAMSSCSMLMYEEVVSNIAGH